MVKFKSLLFESDRFDDLSKPEKDEKVEDLKNQLNTGNWIVKEPLLYRGREWDGLMKVKDSERYEKREPRDTKLHYDYLIHHFTVNCYPNLPDRRKSRFALTHFGDTNIFGDETYVIFPHKDAKIAYSYMDPYDFIVDMPKRKQGFIKGLKPFFKDGKEKTSLYKKYEDQISKEVKNLMSDLYDVYNGSEMPLSRYGCPEEILEMLNNELDKFNGDEPGEIRKVISGLSNLIWIFESVVLEYFEIFNTGYPENKDMGAGEVLYQGKYLQVHRDLFVFAKEENEIT